MLSAIERGNPWASEQLLPLIDQELCNSITFTKEPTVNPNKQAASSAFELTSPHSAVAESNPQGLKVLMPVGDATETMDTLYPYFRVIEEGCRAVVAGPERRLYHMVLHEIPPAAGIPWDLPRSARAITSWPRSPSATLTPRSTLRLFISGGRRPSTLRYDHDLLRITQHFFAANKPVAVICHGIEIVSAAGVIRGRTVTTVAKCALDCEQGGAKYVDQPVVVDGNLVTARLAGSGSLHARIHETASRPLPVP